MIEVKAYPAVRRAEWSGKGESDMGRVKSFWPLFQHIRKSKIAMTSPVEMEYRRAGDGKVKVVDVPAGDPRSLIYNGPSAPCEQLWSEVQVPVRRKPKGGADKL